MTAPLIALPEIFALVRRDEPSRAMTNTATGEPEPALAAASAAAQTNPKPRRKEQ